MRTLIWLPSARRQYIGTLDYIGQRNARAAVKLEADIDRQVGYLRRMSHLGRPGRVADTRELVVHENYVVIYRLVPGKILILRFLHAHQLYP